MVLIEKFKQKLKEDEHFAELIRGSGMVVSIFVIESIDIDVVLLGFSADFGYLVERRDG